VAAEERAGGEVRQAALRHGAVGQEHHLLDHLVGLAHLQAAEKKKNGPHG
jgi:hypothetical protein